MRHLWKAGCSGSPDDANFRCGPFPIPHRGRASGSLSALRGELSDCGDAEGDRADPQTVAHARRCKASARRQIQGSGITCRFSGPAAPAAERPAVRPLARHYASSATPPPESTKSADIAVRDLASAGNRAQRFRNWGRSGRAMLYFALGSFMR